MTNKVTTIWVVNILSFILFSTLTVTGLVNWLILPKGRGAGVVSVSLRHFLGEIHEWTALFFICVVTVHLALHWKYIKSRLR